MSDFVLSANAATAIATYGVLLHTGAGARREFCIAFVGECVDTGTAVDTVADAAKVAVDYDNMEDAERALFRKQVQYCRAIVGGWKQLGAANQRAFVGGSLPASSAVKLLKAKAAPAPATGSEPATGSGSADGVKVSQPSGAEAISPQEMGVRFASWLDGVEPSKLSKAEAKVIAEVATALEAFRAKVAEQAKQPVRKAA